MNRHSKVTKWISRPAKVSLGLTAFLLLSASAHADAFQCGRLLGEKTWAEGSALLKPVKAYVIPKSISLDGAPSLAEMTVLTQHFFQQTGMSPAGLRAVRVNAYRYYPENTVHPRTDQVSRGSGRDHLVRGPLSGKGTGTNEHFSRANGDFQLEDFRSNGLVPLIDSDPEHGGGITEYIVAKNFEEMRIPVVPHGGAVLLSTSDLPALKEIHPAQRPMQIFRDLSDQRESMKDAIPHVNDRLRLSAALHFWNVDHGALNPENLTHNGKIIDLGHVGPSYPVVSGAHRCTLCLGIHGTSFDGSHLGALDYFFPSRRGNRFEFDVREYRKTYRESNLASLEETQWNRFVQDLLTYLGEGFKPVYLSEAERSAFKAAVNEGLQLNHFIWKSDMSFHMGRMKSEPGPLVRLQDRLLGGAGRSYRDPGVHSSLQYSPQMDHSYEPEKFSYSLRFIMQLAATKYHVPAAEYAGNVNKLSSYLKDTRSPSHFQTLLDFFHQHFSGHSERPDAFGPLFREYPTASEVHYGALSQLKRLPENITDEALAGLVKRIVDRYRRPMTLDPVHFSNVLRDFDLNSE